MWARILNSWRGDRNRGGEPSDGYRVYTTKFDRVITGDQIDHFLGGKGRRAFMEYAAEVDRALTRWRAAAEIAAVEALEAYRTSNGRDQPRDTIACLLLDHSGSLKGQRAIVATAITEIVADFWSRIGIRYEILGFTTQSWHGGRARRRWKMACRPRNPGRLCELLHIVYRSADSSIPGAPWAVRNLLRRELLRENVDGEAIEWAAQRLLLQPETRKLLIIVSDGAPVDDSTLAANDDRYLERHLKAVLAEIEVKGVRPAAVGVGDLVRECYSRHTIIATPADLASSLVPFIAETMRFGQE